MNTVTCPNCRQINAADQPYCANCRQPLPNFAAPNNFAPNNFNVPPPAVAVPPKKSNIGKILLIVGGLVAVFGIIIVAVIGYLVTQTLVWKVQGEWKLNDVSVAGKSVDTGQLSGTKIKFQWGDKATITLPNGKSQNTTYEVIDNKQIKIAGAGDAPTTTYDVSISGDKMTATTSKNGVTAVMKYDKVE